jgi:hypothetical protein
VHKIIIQGPFESQTELNIAVSNVVTQVKVESQVPKKPVNQGFSHIETKKPPQNEMVYIVSTSVDDFGAVCGKCGQKRYKPLLLIIRNTAFIKIARYGTFIYSTRRGFLINRHRQIMFGGYWLFQLR